MSNEALKLALAVLMVPCPDCAAVPSYVEAEDGPCDTCAAATLSGNQRTTGEVARYPGLWQECPGVPNTVRIDGVQTVRFFHSLGCCDGSGKRLVSDREAAWVLTEDSAELFIRAIASEAGLLCEECGGTGVHEDGFDGRECELCGGTGVRIKEDNSGF